MTGLKEKKKVIQTQKKKKVLQIYLQSLAKKRIYVKSFK